MYTHNLFVKIGSCSRSAGSFVTTESVLIHWNALHLDLAVNASFVSLSVFLLAVWALTETYALAGLWWAMVVFVIARAISLWVYVPRFWNHFSQDDEVTV